MRKISNRLFLLFVIMSFAFGIFGLTSCTSEESKNSLKLSFEQKEYELEVGQQIEISPIVTNAGEEQLYFVWKSYNVDVASVSNGIVTGNLIGKTQVKVSVYGQPSVSATVTIKVVSQNQKPTVEFESVKKILNLNDTFQIEYTILDSENTYTPVYASLNEEVLTVDETGLITTHSEGSAVVVVKFYDSTTGKFVSYNFSIDVYENYPINYVLNGGINSENNPDGYTASQKPFALEPATKEGYKFAGWYDNANLEGTAVVKVNTALESEITLYAKWETYTVEEAINMEDGEFVAIKGKVKEINIPYDSDYKNTTITISDETGDLKIFRMNDDGTLEQNDIILLEGTITTYDESRQIAQGATYQLIEKGLSKITIEENDSIVEGIDTEIVNGTKVEFTVTAKNGYNVISVELDGTEIFATNGVYSFTVSGNAAIYVDTLSDSLAKVQVARFEFGANTTGANESDTKTDGSYVNEYSSSYNDYLLELDELTNVYAGAYDTKGKLSLKLGTSKKVGSFNFIVPEDVDYVIIKVAGYKTNTAKLNINNKEYTITTYSANSEYTEIEIDTRKVKTISLTTLTGGYRCKIDSINYYKLIEKTDVTGKEMDLELISIEDACALTDDSEFKIEGTVVSIDTAWNESYGNLTATISDETGSIQAFRLATKVYVGDKVSICGIKDTYESKHQIAKGAVATIVERAKGTISYSATNATISETANAEATLPETAENGTKVEFIVTPDEGFEITSVTVNGTTITAVDGVYSFEVSGNTEVVVTATEETSSEGGSEETTPTTVTYKFEDYTAGTQYAQNEKHVMDNVLTIYTTQAHFTTQLRLYSSSTNNGYAILESTKGISSISVNAGYKKDTINVYSSEDGIAWELVGTIATTTTNYADYSLDFGGSSYKYLKLDVAGTNQIRIASLTVTYEETSGGGESEETTPTVLTYKFEDYTAGTQYAQNEKHVMDNVLTIYTTQAHFTTQLRLYSSSTNNGYAILESTKGISSISVNAGYKKDTINVYSSEDGIAWELVGTITTTTTNYADYSLDFGGSSYKYLKLDVAGSNQVRIASLTVTYNG